MVKVNLNIDVPDTFISAVVDAPFDIAKKALEQEGYDIISFGENALLKFQAYEEHVEKIKRLNENRGDMDIFRHMPKPLSLGNCVREGVVYVPGDGRYITRNSPVMKRPEEFVAAEKAGRPFYITQNELKEALESSVKVPYEFPYKITERKFKGDKDRIPLKNFEDDGVMNFCFKGYSSFIKEFLEGIKQESIPINLCEEYYVNEQEGPFADKLSFGGIGNYSAIWTTNQCVRGILYLDKNKVVEVKI